MDWEQGCLLPRHGREHQQDSVASLALQDETGIAQSDTQHVSSGKGRKRVKVKRGLKAEAEGEEGWNQPPHQHHDRRGRKGGQERSGSRCGLRLDQRKLSLRPRKYGNNSEVP